jgi:dihydropteroate synthase
VIPALRIVPSLPAQRLAGVPDVAFCGSAQEAVARAADALALPTRAEGGLVAVTGSPADFELLATRLADDAPEIARALQRYLHPQPGWRLRTRTLDLSRPWIMGVLNLTEDSFSGDGVGREVDSALRRADALRAAGADIIDVGAESARADRPVMDEAAETDLVHTAIAALVRDGHCISSDSYKPAVARAALAAGADVVNDISGLTLGLGAALEAAASRAGYVLNYSYSVPKRRPDSPPLYEDVVAETVAWMGERLAQLEAAGMDAAHIAVDPGIAFGKSHDEDIQVLRRIGELTTFGQPVLLAHSRKNYIGSITGQPPAARDLETHISAALAYAQGARIFRVHDAAGARRALDIAAAIVTANAGDFAPDAESWPWRAGASAAHMTNATPDKSAPKGQRW